MQSQQKAKFKSNHSCNVCQERVVACNSELGKLCCSSLAANGATHAKQVLSELPHKEVLWSSRQGGLESGADDHILVPKNTENPETMSATKNSVYLVNKKLYKSANRKQWRSIKQPRL